MRAVKGARNMRGTHQTEIRCQGERTRTIRCGNGGFGSEPGDRRVRWSRGTEGHQGKDGGGYSSAPGMSDASARSAPVQDGVRQEDQGRQKQGYVVQVAPLRIQVHHAGSWT